MNIGAPYSRMAWSDSIQNILTSTRRNLVGIERGPTKYCNSCFFHSNYEDSRLPKTNHLSYMVEDPGQREDCAVVMKSKPQEISSQKLEQDITDRLEDRLESNNMNLNTRIGNNTENIKLLRSQYLQMENYVKDTFQDIEQHIVNLQEVLKERDATQPLTPSIEAVIVKKLDERFKVFDERFNDQIQKIDDRTHESLEQVLKDIRETQKMKLSFEEQLTERARGIEKFANDLIKKQNKEIDQRLEANETLTKDLDRKLSTKIMELTRQLEGLKAEQSTDTLVDELNEAKSDIAQLTEVIKNITKDNKMLKQNYNELMEATKALQKKQNTNINLKIKDAMLERDSRDEDMKKTLMLVLKRLDVVEKQSEDDNKKLVEVDEEMQKLHNENIEVKEDMEKQKELANEFAKPIRKNNKEDLETIIEENKKKYNELNEQMEEQIKDVRDNYTELDRVLNEKITNLTKEIKTLKLEANRNTSEEAKSANNDFEEKFVFLNEEIEKLKQGAKSFNDELAQLETQFKQQKKFNDNQTDKIARIDSSINEFRDYMLQQSNIPEKQNIFNDHEEIKEKNINKAKETYMSNLYPQEDINELRNEHIGKLIKPTQDHINTPELEKDYDNNLNKISNEDYNSIDNKSIANEPLKNNSEIQILKNEKKLISKNKTSEQDSEDISNPVDDVPESKDEFQASHKNLNEREMIQKKNDDFVTPDPYINEEEQFQDAKSSKHNSEYQGDEQIQSNDQENDDMDGEINNKNVNTQEDHKDDEEINYYVTHPKVVNEKTTAAFNSYLNMIPEEEGNEDYPAPKTPENVSDPNKEMYAEAVSTSGKGHQLPSNEPQEYMKSDSDIFNPNLEEDVKSKEVKKDNSKDNAINEENEWLADLDDAKFNENDDELEMEGHSIDKTSNRKDETAFNKDESK